MAARVVAADARSFIAVNMGGLSEGLFESELFGHVKGSFTDAKTDRVGRFELADARHALSRRDRHRAALAAVEAAARAADGRRRARRLVQGAARRRARHLGDERESRSRRCAEGRFREDLLFRLNTIEIHLPPLRDRREDIPPLAMHFLRRHATRYRKPLTGFDAGAMQMLLAHPWPGNIRELDHAIERAVLLAQGEQIRAGDLGLRAASSAAPRLEDLPLEDVEKMLIQKALAATRATSAAPRRRSGCRAARCTGESPAMDSERRSAGAGARRARRPADRAPLPASRAAHLPPGARSPGLPGVVVSMVLLWRGGYSGKVQWTLGLVVIGSWVITALVLRERVVRPLQTLSNMLAALREGDYSIRARGADRDDALGLGVPRVESPRRNAAHAATRRDGSDGAAAYGDGGDRRRGVRVRRRRPAAARESRRRATAGASRRATARPNGGAGGTRRWLAGRVAADDGRDVSRRRRADGRCGADRFARMGVRTRCSCSPT